MQLLFLIFALTEVLFVNGKSIVLKEKKLNKIQTAPGGSQQTPETRNDILKEEILNKIPSKSQTAPGGSQQTPETRNDILKEEILNKIPSKSQTAPGGSQQTLETRINPISKGLTHANIERKLLDGRRQAALKAKAFDALFVTKRTNENDSEVRKVSALQEKLHTKHHLKSNKVHLLGKFASRQNSSNDQTSTMYKEHLLRYRSRLPSNDTTKQILSNETLEKRECCHHWDHAHDLMELHNNPHHYGSDFMHGPAHDEFHTIDEHGERLDLGDEDLGGGGGGHHGHGLYEGGGAGYTEGMYGAGGEGGNWGGGGGGEGGNWGGGGGGEGGNWGGGGGGGGGSYNPHTHYNSYHNEPHYHQQDINNEPHYHEHHHHYNPTFQHNDYHYVDDHHEHYHHQPHFVNNEVHIHHEENNNHDDEIEHYGSGHHSNYGHGGYHHVKVGLHGPGKSPEQWQHQQQHEDSHMGGGEDDEQLNNYDTGAGFFQLDEHGGEVDITSLHKGGTKVHMGGGHFSVVRDPWRFHSAFAGLLQPHESIANSMAGGGGGYGGGGGGGIQQFHQHFTYINNERNEKTKVQNLVHHQHEGEVGSEEHHFSEHHDDHHLHHEHEHVGHHDDMGGDHHDDHGSHHHHHEEDEAHHHYEEHHQDALHSPDGGGGGYGHGTGGGMLGGGGGRERGAGMAYSRHNMNYRDGGEYDAKPFPGNVVRGAEQFKGTPEDDNYRQDRAPAMVGVKRSVKQLTPLAAFVGYTNTGIKRELGSKEKNETTEFAIADDRNDELSLDKKTMGSIADEMRLENETMQSDLSSLEGGQSRDMVRKVFFNSLIKHESNDDATDADDVDDVNEKRKDDALLKDYVPEGSGSGSGSGEAEKRSITAGNVRGGDVGGGVQEISGNNPLEDSVIHGPEAGISRVFIEPMIVKKKKKAYIPGERSLLSKRLKLFRKAVFTGDEE